MSKYLIKNEQRDIEIRRLSSILSSVGVGIILFSLWTIIKIVSMVWLDPTFFFDPIKEQYAEDSPEFSVKVMYIVCLIFLAAVVFLDTWMRLYIGIHARRESQGIYGGNLYLFLTGFMILTSLTTVVLSIALPLIKKTEFTETISSFIVELTSMAMMIEMIYAAKRIRKLRRSEED